MKECKKKFKNNSWSGMKPIRIEEAGEKASVNSSFLYRTPGK